MKETGLPMIAPMVLATLADLKTNTRRVMLPQPINVDEHGRWYRMPGGGESLNCYDCPYGGPGDRLYVREACAIGWHDGGPLAVDYHADGKRRIFEPDTDQKAQAAAAYIGDSRRPPFLMPKWAARIWLEIVSVKVQRVQEITLDDCKREGIAPYTFAKGALAEPPPDPRWKFIELWDGLNAKRGYSWESNCWVWAITFRRLRESELSNA